MKKENSTLQLPSQDSSIAAIRSLVAAITARHRKNCHEAVLAGMHLLYLKNLHGIEHGGDRRSLTQSIDSRKGFTALMNEIGVPRKSAYRWMGKAMVIAKGLGITDDENDFPSPGEDSWDLIADAAEHWSIHTSLDRIQVGSTEDDPDEVRFEHLMSQAEAGDEMALSLIDRWRAGEITLARAACAYGGAEATKGKTRNDPSYLSFNLVKKTTVGLIPKAFTTLRNGFANWDSYDERARADVRSMWEEVLKTAPLELTTLLKKYIQ